MTTKGDPIQEVLKAHLERGPASENPDFQLAFCPAFDLHLLFRDRSRSSLPVVNGLYAGILNRLPDESGLELWSAYLDAGSSASWMGFELLASAEGRRQASGIRASAMDILRRGEVLERLPILRQAGVLAFLSSPVRLEVVAAFLVTLGRCPNEAELIAVTDQVYGGQRIADLLVGMADSEEAHRGGLRWLPGRIRRALMRPSLLAEWSARVAILRADLELVAADPAALDLRAS